MIEYLTITAPYSIIALGLLSGGLIFVCERLYYRRLATQMKWRSVFSKGILKQSRKLKKDFNLTQQQKNFLNFILSTANSKSTLRSFCAMIAFPQRYMEQGLTATNILGIKENDALFKEVAGFMVLCFLHASTYNFIIGPFFRYSLFADVLDSSQPVKAATERKDFIKRPESLTIIQRNYRPFFSTILQESNKNNLKTA